MDLRELLAKTWTGIVRAGKVVGEAVAELDAPNYEQALFKQPFPTNKDTEHLALLPIEYEAGYYTLSIFPSTSKEIFYIAKDADMVGTFVESNFIVTGELDGHRLHVAINAVTQQVEVQADGIHAGKVLMKDLSKVAEFHVDGAEPERIYRGHAKKWSLTSTLDFVLDGDTIVAERIKWPFKFNRFHSYRVHHSLSKYTVLALWSAFRPNSGT